MYKRVALMFVFAGAVMGFGQEATPSAQDPSPRGQAPEQGGFKRREEPQAAGQYQIAAGTHVLLNMINSVSTKQAQPGDRLYLETAFPVLSGARIVIPQGSWVTGPLHFRYGSGDTRSC
jgi:hypothetical protein